MARPLPGCSITETMLSGAMCFSAIALFSESSSALTTISLRACEFFHVLLLRDYRATSKRSRFITLVQAATKSFTNFSFESAHA